MKSPIVECVPNFSEGRDRRCTDELCFAIAAVPGVRLLDRTSDWDHHRSVLTFAGPPAAVSEAAVRLAIAAVKLIDLNCHCGIHPRLGALDVLPFVPIAHVTIAECVALAHETGQRIFAETGVPVFFYGAAALRPERVALENVRRGEFESMRETADIGGPALHKTAGAVIVGVRKVLIAFNINLATGNLVLAKSIAHRIRASSGGFPAVKALGLALLSRGLVQVSMNLTDFEQTPLHVVYAEVERLAAAEGVQIEATEVIGLLPRSAHRDAREFGIKLPPDIADRILEDRLERLALAGVSGSERSA